MDEIGVYNISCYAKYLLNNVNSHFKKTDRNVTRYSLKISLFPRLNLMRIHNTHKWTAVGVLNTIQGEEDEVYCLSLMR